MLFFFFKQKTAYEMRISDWSSDVCSSDLKVTGFLGAGNKPQPISEREAARYFGGMEAAKSAPKREIQVDYDIGDQVKVLDGPFASFNGLVEIGRASCRERVCQYV